MKVQELEKVTGKLRELVELSGNEPQIIYDGDRPVRVMISYDLFDGMLQQQKKENIVPVEEFFQTLRVIQTDEPIELDPVERFDRSNAFLELFDDTSA